MKNIGILYIGIGEYVRFWKGFYISMENKFATSSQKHYYVFTDAETIFGEENENVTRIYQKNLGWPGNTIERFAFFLSIKEQLKENDYLFFMNANIYVAKEVKEEEILPVDEDFVFVEHHAFTNGDVDSYTYDRNPKCNAYIPYGEGKYYITGGINGGKADAFLRMSEELNGWIHKDYENGVMALWHDESMINKYCYINENYKILSPAYFYPELSGDVSLPYERKIVARDKRRYINVAGLKQDVSLIEASLKLWLKDAHYFRLYHKYLLLKASGISLIDSLGKYDSLCIYSCRDFGEVLIKEFESSGYKDKVKYVIDTNPEGYRGLYPIRKKYDEAIDIDAVLIANTYDYCDEYCDVVRYCKNVINLEDVINDMILSNSIDINSRIW